MSLLDRFKKIESNTPKEPELPNRIIGKIYHLNKKGFGFIESEAIPQERIYFHWKSLNHNTRKFSDLKNGDRVEFTPRQYDKAKGWVGLRVTLVE